IEGRVAALNSEGSQGLAGLNVYFISQNKEIVKSVTAADGSFMVLGLQEGAYSFVASGPNGFAAYGVHVVGEATEGVNNVMEAAAVAPSTGAVKRILRDNIPAEVVNELVGNDIGPAPAATNRVMLVDGKLNGNVFALLGGQDSVEGTRVHILDGETEVASVGVDQAGKFSIDGLSPGVYSIVAVGKNGFAAVAFEAVAQPANAVVDGEIPVSVEPSAIQDTLPAQSIQIPFNGNAVGMTLDIILTPRNDLQYIEEQRDEVLYVPNEEVYYTDFAPVEYYGESVGYGGAMGGSSGSVGNFAGAPSGGFGGGAGPLRGGLGGGGRLGRLALLSGAVVGIVAIADSGSTGPASNAAP
ncbi:MAG: hypothetical protein WBD31_00375, partial [Rubripirellula sp.]